MFRCTFVDKPSRLLMLQIIVPGLALPIDSLEYLFELYKCRDFISAPHPKTEARDEALRRKQTGISFYGAPELEEWLKDDAIGTSRYDYSKEWETGKNEPVLILHTSGSTGIILFSLRHAVSFS